MKISVSVGIKQIWVFTIAFLLFWALQLQFHFNFISLQLSLSLSQHHFSHLPNRLHVHHSHSPDNAITCTGFPHYLHSSLLCRTSSNYGFTPMTTAPAFSAILRLPGRSVNSNFGRAISTLSRAPVSQLTGTQFPNNLDW